MSKSSHEETLEYKIGHLSSMSQPLLTFTCSSSTAVKKPVKKSIRRTTMLTSEIFDGVSDNSLTDIIVVFLQIPM